MRIISMRPVPPGADRSRALARFDWQATPGLRLLNWTLKRNAGGEWRTYAPNVRDGGNIAATLSHELTLQVTELAISAFNESTGVRNAHDDRSAA
jgi:hypothetical protein